MLSSRRVKWVYPFANKHRKACITNVASFINLLDNQPPPIYHPRHTLRSIGESTEEHEHQSIDGILPRHDDAERQASLLSTISELFSNLTSFDSSSSATSVESPKYQAIPPSISILPSIKFNTVSDVLKKIYDEQIFGREGEQEYWQMVANEEAIDDSFMTGFTVPGIDHDSTGTEDALSSGGCILKEIGGKDIVYDPDAWNGKLLILGHAQLRLLDTPLLLHLTLLFRIPDSHGKSRRQLEKTLLDYYQSKLDSQNIEWFTNEMTFDMPRQAKKKIANNEASQEKERGVTMEWRLEEDRMLKDNVPRLLSEHQELTHTVTAWINSFLTQNPTWIVDAPKTYADTMGTQVWKVISEDLKRAFVNEDWFKGSGRGEKHVKQRWNVLERNRLQGWLEQMARKVEVGGKSVDLQ